MQLTACLPTASLIGPDAEANKASVKAALLGRHHWTADGEPCFADVESVLIASQPVGALFDYLLDDYGRAAPGRKARKGQEIGVVGIGMNTLELLAVDGITPIERFIGGYSSGVRRLLDLSNPGGYFTIAEMDARLRSEQLNLTNSLPTWSNEVIGKIEEQWGSAWKRFSNIIIVGGGSILLRQVLARKFGALAVFPGDSVLSTARGAYKLSLMKHLTEAVAFDAGYGSIKLYCAAGSVIMPAAVSLNGTAAIGPLAGLSSIKHRPLHIESTHGSFYVGASAHAFGRPVQSMDLDRLTGPEMLALFYGALSTQAAACVDLAG